LTKHDWGDQSLSPSIGRDRWYGPAYSIDYLLLPAGDLLGMNTKFAAEWMRRVDSGIVGHFVDKKQINHVIVPVQFFETIIMNRKVSAFLTDKIILSFQVGLAKINAAARRSDFLKCLVLSLTDAVVV